MDTIEQGKRIGRPSKLTPEVLALTLAYVSGGFLGEPTNEVVPTIAGLACVLGVARKTIRQWADRKIDDSLQDDSDEYAKLLNDFSTTVEGLQAKQEFLIARGGLIGDFNPTIAKLMLGNHGYSDKGELDNRLQNPDGSAIVTGFNMVIVEDGTKPA
mgnify:CR=1 FL=1